MTIWKTIPLAISLGALLTAGCRAPAPAPPPPPAKQNLFVLLPNDDGSSGSIVVTNAGGSQQLTQANSAVKVERADAAPTKPFVMDPGEIRNLFQDALSFIPAAEARFNLYFLPNSTELTAESAAMLPNVLQAYKERHSTDVSIVGHTDTTGSSEANLRLGMARAQQIAKTIEALGVERASIFTESHGANDLLVPTGENVSEPRNRRVEVIVR
jgi:outer membrane protein OmpA-like peptidoglycan-associated protein